MNQVEQYYRTIALFSFPAIHLFIDLVSTFLFIPRSNLNQGQSKTELQV